MAKFGWVLMSVFLIFSFSIVDALAVQQKVRLNVPGVTWASSAAAAGSAASSVKGVISVEENFNDNTLTVVFDDAVVSVDNIKKALKEEGYPVSGPPEYVEGQK